MGAAGAWRAGDRSRALLGGAALTWSALVVAMAAALGYAAISRFFLAAAAVACALAGAGALDAAEVLRRRGSARATALAGVVGAFTLSRLRRRREQA